MGRFDMNTLEPPDDELERAAEAYESADCYLPDALEHLAEQDPDQIPAGIVAAVAVWYSRTEQYETVVEDIAAGEYPL